MDVAETILNIINDNNLTQQTFAKRINVNQSQISDWTSGKSKPSFDAIKDICLAFNLSADYVIGLKDIKTSKTKFKLSNRRYTGSKLRIKDWIKDLITKNCPNAKSFCDIFAGTAVVSDELLNEYDTFILNDLLYSNEIIYKAFYKNEEFDLNKLFEYQTKYQLLNKDNLIENYVSINFGDKYFEMGDARAIGYIRQDIEDNKKFLNEREYAILLASLLYSFDRCANTVGHYEAYFKNKIIDRTFKFELITPYDTLEMNKKFCIYRRDANELATEISSDIVYIDPPYSSRQYSRFYHVLENITKWEKPKLFGSALKPAPENMSEYCSSSAKNAFRDLVNKLNCKYIVVSYNNTYNSKSKSSENKMLLEDIVEILSEKGQTKKYEMPLKAFNAGKTNIDNHKELIFITEVGKFAESKKDLNRSPFFYVGDKYKLMPQLLKIFPKNIDTYFEPFCGGGSPFLNIVANKYVLNDIDEYMIKLHKMLINYSVMPDMFYSIIKNIETEYNLSASRYQDIIPQNLKDLNPKTYFAKFNKDAYSRMRNAFNKDKSNDVLLYLLLIYGFNRMLRFNSKGDFNLPVGNVDFNQNVEDAINSYFSFVQNKDISLSSLDFREYIKVQRFNKNDFIYLDPPYLITNSEYNKLWTEKDEIDLLTLLDELNEKEIRFAISNMITTKEKTNEIFLKWAQKYNIYNINSNYISYHDNTNKISKEVLVTNYDKRKKSGKKD
ncbi:MAG: Dam family site-specific DNA-(adenine-N6)-methyltransferase [Clostridia bacterium]|nr:Dam family site-specific DNA-(adenine-N6)-methyltransferase [Clostridia bacterium]